MCGLRHHSISQVDEDEKDISALKGPAERGLIVDELVKIGRKRIEPDSRAVANPGRIV